MLVTVQRGLESLMESSKAISAKSLLDDTLDCQLSIYKKQSKAGCLYLAVYKAYLDKKIKSSENNSDQQKLYDGRNVYNDDPNCDGYILLEIPTNLAKQPLSYKLNLYYLTHREVLQIMDKVLNLEVQVTTKNRRFGGLPCYKISFAKLKARTPLEHPQYTNSKYCIPYIQRVKVGWNGDDHSQGYFINTPELGKDMKYNTIYSLYVDQNTRTIRQIVLPNTLNTLTTTQIKGLLDNHYFIEPRVLLDRYRGKYRSLLNTYNIDDLSQTGYIQALGGDSTFSKNSQHNRKPSHLTYVRNTLVDLLKEPECKEINKVIKPLLLIIQRDGVGLGYGDKLEVRYSAKGWAGQAQSFIQSVLNYCPSTDIISEIKKQRKTANNNQVKIFTGLVGYMEYHREQTPKQHFSLVEIFKTPLYDKENDTLTIPYNLPLSSTTFNIIRLTSTKLHKLNLQYPYIYFNPYQLRETVIDKWVQNSSYLTNQQFGEVKRINHFLIDGNIIKGNKTKAKVAALDLEQVKLNLLSFGGHSNGTKQVVQSLEITGFKDVVLSITRNNENKTGFVQVKAIKVEAKSVQVLTDYEEICGIEELDISGRLKILNHIHDALEFNGLYKLTLPDSKLDFNSQGIKVYNNLDIYFSEPQETIQIVPLELDQAYNNGESRNNIQSAYFNILNNGNEHFINSIDVHLEGHPIKYIDSELLEDIGVGQVQSEVELILDDELLGIVAHANLNNLDQCSQNKYSYSLIKNLRLLSIYGIYKLKSPTQHSIIEVDPEIIKSDANFSILSSKSEQINKSLNRAATLNLSRQMILLQYLNKQIADLSNKSEVDLDFTQGDSIDTIINSATDSNPSNILDSIYNLEALNSKGLLPRGYNANDNSLLAKYLKHLKSDSNYPSIASGSPPSRELSQLQYQFYSIPIYKHEVLEGVGHYAVQVDKYEQFKNIQHPNWNTRKNGFCNVINPSLGGDFFRQPPILPLNTIDEVCQYIQKYDYLHSLFTSLQLILDLKQQYCRRIPIDNLKGYIANIEAYEFIQNINTYQHLVSNNEIEQVFNHSIEPSRSSLIDYIDTTANPKFNDNKALDFQLLKDKWVVYTRLIGIYGIKKNGSKDFNTSLLLVIMNNRVVDIIELKGYVVDYFGDNTMLNNSYLKTAHKASTLDLFNLIQSGDLIQLFNSNIILGGDILNYITISSLNRDNSLLQNNNQFIEIYKLKEQILSSLRDTFRYTGLILHSYPVGYTEGHKIESIKQSQYYGLKYEFIQGLSEKIHKIDYNVYGWLGFNHYTDLTSLLNQQIIKGQRQFYFLDNQS